MSDFREQYLEWLLGGKQGPRPGSPGPQASAPTGGEVPNPDAGLPALSGTRALEPMGPRSLVPPSAGGGALAGDAASAMSPWAGVGLPVAAAALYSQDANPGEDEMLDKILGRGDADPTKKQDIFQNVSDAYSREQNKGDIGAPKKVIPAPKRQQPVSEMDLPPTTPQVKNLEDLRVLNRLQERKQLQQDMGLTPKTPEERQQEVDGIRAQPDSFNDRFKQRLNLRNTLK